MQTIVVRNATPVDQSFLVEFNSALAWESEGKQLDLDLLKKGVAAIFDDPQKGLYIVAEIENTVAGQLMITTEWSDWRNGWFWWIQSVYVRSDFRRQGVFRSLFLEAVAMAKRAGDVVGMRLYVERENSAAQQTYRELGMDETGYFVLEMSPITGFKPDA